MTDAPEAHRKIVANILASKGFRRSARQRELLEYLYREAAADPPREAHEQDIGVAVFGKPEGYDTSQDNIVRVNVSELRKKLDEYFRTEGAGEAYTLEFPRGSYAPVFRPREVEKPEEPAPPAVPVTPAVPRRAAGRWVLAAALAAVAVLAAACAYLAFRNAVLVREAEARQAPVSPLWSQFFRGNRETDVIVADSCISLLTDILGTPITLQEYINRSYLLGGVAGERNGERRRELELLMARRYTSMADVLAVQRITHLAALDRRTFSVYFSRDYPSQRLRSMNLILLGSKRSNPWVEAFEGRLNFQLEYDPWTGGNRVRNRNPKPGEEASYAVPGGTVDPRVSLAIVAYLPATEGNAEVMILEGAGTQGTLAAADIFASPAPFERVRAVLPKSRSGRIPFFEALLRTESVGSMVQTFTVLASRTIL